MSRRERRRHPEPERRPMPLGHCPLTGKLRWAKRDHARDHVRQLRAQGARRDPRAAVLGTYRCRACDAWHAGHRGQVA